MTASNYNCGTDRERLGRLRRGFVCGLLALFAICSPETMPCAAAPATVRLYEFLASNVSLRWGGRLSYTNGASTRKAKLSEWE